MQLLMISGRLVAVQEGKNQPHREAASERGIFFVV